MRNARLVRTRQGILLGALVVGLFLAMQSTAYAGLIGVKLMTGGTTLTCLDTAPCDTNPSLGAVTLNAVISAWTVNVTTGQSYPILGTQASPWIDMNSVHTFTDSGPSTLEVLVSQTDYTGAIGSSHFHGGGTQTNMSGFHEIWYDNSNAQFGFVSLIDQHPAPATQESFSWDNHPASPAVDSLYSLTLRAVLNAGPGTSTTSFNHEYFAQVDQVPQVPEPGWALLLGSTLGLVGLMRGRRLPVAV